MQQVTLRTVHFIAWLRFELMLGKNTKCKLFNEDVVQTSVNSTVFPKSYFTEFRLSLLVSGQYWNVGHA